MEVRAEIFFGDSKEQLKNIPDDSVDLIVTSPPYADQRKGTYGAFTLIYMSNSFFRSRKNLKEY
jgi:DNA modification methylase